MLWIIAMALVSALAVGLAMEFNLVVAVITWTVLTLFLLVIKPI